MQDDIDDGVKWLVGRGWSMPSALHRGRHRAGRSETRRSTPESSAPASPAQAGIGASCPPPRPAFRLPPNARQMKPNLLRDRHVRNIVLPLPADRPISSPQSLHRQVKRSGGSSFPAPNLLIRTPHGGHRPTDAIDRARGASARLRSRAREDVRRRRRSDAPGDGRAARHAPADDRRLRRTVAAHLRQVRRGRSDRGSLSARSVVARHRPAADAAQGLRRLGGARGADQADATRSTAASN